MILLVLILYLASSIEPFVPRNVSIDLRNAAGADRRAGARGVTLRSFNPTFFPVNFEGARRAAYKFTHIPTKRPQAMQTHLRNKLLGLMKQAWYLAQERIWPAEKILQKYENSTPYRMAFIFMKLEQLTHEGQGIMRYLEGTRDGVNRINTTQRLQVYWQLVRRNVDVTYLVDYIQERVPLDQISHIKKWVAKKEQEDMQRTLLRQKNGG